MPNAIYYIDLINRYREGELSSDEKRELEQWRRKNRRNEAFFQMMTNDEKFGQWVAEELRTKRAVWNKIVDRAPELRYKQSTRFRLTVPSWKYLTAAAAVLLLVIGGWYYTYRKPAASFQSVSFKPSETSDLPPGTNKAVLTLAGGRTIVLDSSKNGEIARQGNIKIEKVGSGVLIYFAAGSVNAKLINSLSTPRGGQYQLALPDGSRVWLNAATTVEYPAAFGNTERLVNLSGEAYFEVAKDAARPFRVRINNQATVEVLGTHFNIKAYKDEPQITATLLEGSVRFNPATGAGALLRPGEEAILGANSEVSILNNVDVDNIIAWKNGMTSFYKADIREIMRIVSRWYDVDIEYRGKVITKHFGGGIPRSANLSELLNVMELNGIHCTLEGKKIIVNTN